MTSAFTDPSFAAMIGIVLVIAVIFLFFSLGLYILRSIGLSRLARNRGMSGAGLAWIPIIGIYRIGAIADDISEKSGSKTYFRYFMLAGILLSWILSIIPTASSAMSDNSYSMTGVGAISFLLPIAQLVITIISLNKIYKCYRPASSTSWTVLSVIFNFMQSIFLFIIRNDFPAPVWGAPPPAGYYPPNMQGGPNFQIPPQDAGYVPPGAPNPPTWDDINRPPV